MCTLIQLGAPLAHVEMVYRMQLGSWVHLLSEELRRGMGHGAWHGHEHD